MSRDRYVYFLRPIGQPGPVKIGCSELPEKRLKTLMAWSPVPLEIAASTPGDAADEACLHGMFKTDHTHGEWFRASDRLTALVEKVAAGASLDAVLDRSIPRPNFRKYSGHTVRLDPEWRHWNSYSRRLSGACRRIRADRVMPAKAAAIMDRWRGGKVGTVWAPSAPSAEDIAYLETVISDPAAHAVISPWSATRYQDAAA